MPFSAEISKTRAVRGISFRFDNVALDSWKGRRDGHTAEVDTTIRLVRMIYTRPANVSPSGKGGTNLLLGTIAHPAKFASWVTPESASDGQVVTITLPPDTRTLVAGETLCLRNGNGKKNAGIVCIQIELQETR